ncbi:MAG: hypothetical protein ACOX7B_07995 [Christensenellales bacterium]|jgi:hypothetical protein
MTRRIDKGNLARTANYLVGTGMTRSDAFKAAWLMAKRGGVTKVAGVTFDNRQRLIARLATYSPELVSITLQQDKANLFDPQAVAVVASVKDKGSATIGFIPSLTARTLSRLMDKGTTFKASLDRIVGGYEGLSYGARLRVAI